MKTKLIETFASTLILPVFDLQLFASPDYYAAHRFFIVAGTTLKDLVTWPDLSREPVLTEVVTDQRFQFNIPTGITKVEAYEFEFNMTKRTDSAHRYLEAWFAAGDARQVNIVETDEAGDPNDPTSIVADYDLGLSRPTAPQYPGGSKDSPKAAKVKIKIMAVQMKQRDLV